MAANESQPLVTAVVIGAGSRGTLYSSYGVDFSEKLKIVAVAEPREVGRNRIKKWFNLPNNRCYTDWKDLLKEGKIADCAIIATQDSMHKDPAIQCAGLGYHILLEKPMAVTADDCLQIYKACSDAGILLAVCHVLRYFPPVLKIYEMITSGIIGDVVHIQHTENVGFWHFAHSFVRGNWRNTRESSFALLAKCCHDVDLVHYWMGGRKCTKITSVGSLLHFRKENKPKEAADRCHTCPVEKSCLFSANKIYIKPIEDLVGNARPNWPQNVVYDPREGITWDKYRSGLKSHLETGPYGRCVYACDNDVCDNQTVSFQFENGATATVTMIAFTEEVCLRTTKVFGTRGTLFWKGKPEGPIIHEDFSTRTKKEILPKLNQGTGGLTGHGGADFCLMDSFVKAVAYNNPSYIKSGAEDSLRSHLLVFAAEEFRTNQKGEYSSLT